MPSKWLKLFPSAQRSQAQFLLDGEAAFRSMLEAFDTAGWEGHYIYILGWMLDIDAQLCRNNTDSTLLDYLARASKRGVEIRILVWDNIDPEYHEKLGYAMTRLNRLANTRMFVDAHTFSPPRSLELLPQIAPTVRKAVQYLSARPPDTLDIGDDRRLSASYVIYRLLELLNHPNVGSHHEKVIIVNGSEGLIAYCGGIDFNRNRVITKLDGRSRRFPYCHDVACRLQGPAAYQVLEKFRLRWRNHPQASAVSLLGANTSEPRATPDPAPYAMVVGTYNSPDGKHKVRTLKRAYLDIIDAAEKYVYIEDQYLVNVEVARHLNATLKKSRFEKLILVIQDSIETSDIYIPNRKRTEFWKALLDGLSEPEKGKVVLMLLDKTHWRQERYHPAMHAKTLIVDDEIAMIGSANVNRRSFTCDSETSVVVFDDSPKRSFARKFRIATWREYMRIRGVAAHMPRSIFEHWVPFANALRDCGGFAKITRYEKHSREDLDQRIADKIESANGLVAVGVGYLVDGDLQAMANAAASGMHSAGIAALFDVLWECLIDPEVS